MHPEDYQQAAHVSSLFFLSPNVWVATFKKVSPQRHGAETTDACIHAASVCSRTKSKKLMQLLMFEVCDGFAKHQKSIRVVRMAGELVEQRSQEALCGRFAFLQ